MRLMLLLFIAVGLPAWPGCYDYHEKKPYEVRIEIYSTMKQEYLWYESVPDLDPLEYESSFELTEDLRDPDRDPWTRLVYTSDLRDYLDRGDTGVNHGFWIDDASTTIILVYPGTTAYDAGVRRGWRVHKVNGTLATAENVHALLDESPIDKIVFKDHDDLSVVLTLEERRVYANPVVHSELLTIAKKKVGYFVLNDFINTAYTQLNLLMYNFIIDGIDEVIIDLRYNSGGRARVATHLASQLTDQANIWDIFFHYVHNDKQALKDRAQYFVFVLNRLALDRLFFITSENTAGASELVMNGLDPYIEVIRVGSATRGMSVGAYERDIEYTDLSLLPISFTVPNSDDFDGYFDTGLLPTFPAEDDITRDFGDPKESSLAAALYYIKNGTPPTTPPGVITSPDISRYRAFGELLTEVD